MTGAEGHAEILRYARAAQDDGAVDAALRLHLLSETVRRAGQSIPFYAGRDGGPINRFDDLRRLPVISRRDLEAGAERFRDPERPASGWLFSSATTTGRSVWVAAPEAAPELKSAYYALTRRRYAPEEFLPMLRLLPTGRLFANRNIPEGVFLCFYDDFCDRQTSWSGWDVVISKLFQPLPYAGGVSAVRSIHATPPYALDVLTRRFGDRGGVAQDTALRNLFISGAWMGPKRRAELQGFWSAPVSTTFSATELSTSFEECPKRPYRFHVDHTCHVEILDLETLEPCPPHRPGALVVTGLWPFYQGSALVRYDLGDVAADLGYGGCGCGHAGPAFDFLGRRQHAIRLATPAGEVVVGSVDVLTALDDLDFLVQTPRPQYHLSVCEGAAGEVSVRAEARMIKSSAWKREREDELAAAIRAVFEARAAERGLSVERLAVRAELTPQGGLTHTVQYK